MEMELSEMCTCTKADPYSGQKTKQKLGFVFFGRSRSAQRVKLQNTEIPDVLYTAANTITAVSVLIKQH